MVNPLVSIIVPVYNSEKYLQECVESILNQTYKRIEIILVNDGSTDSSGEICNRYQEQFLQVKVIHTDNGGLVKARKNGLTVAQGEYVGFVDSDDWVDYMMIERMVECLVRKDADLIGSGLACSNGHTMMNGLNEGYYVGKELEEIYGQMIFDFTKSAPGILQSLCTKLIRKSILSEVLPILDDRITYGEDAATVYNCCLKSESIILIDAKYYHYRLHDASMMRNLHDTDIFKKIFYFNEFMKKSLAPYKEEYNLQKQLKMYIIQFLDTGLSRLFGIKISIRKRFVGLSGIFSPSYRIILYGAGKIGRAYYEQLDYEEYSQYIVHWVDKNHVGETINNRKIEGLSAIYAGDYDKILIAVKQKILADEIKAELIYMGISPDNIVWEEPKKSSFCERIISL